MAHVATPPPALPHSLDAEQTLIGALLLDGERMIDVAPVVAAADFYDPLHRVVYAAIERMHEARLPVDPVTVADALRGEDQFSARGGITFLTTLVENSLTSSHATRYAEIVREKSLRRRLATVGDTIATMSRDDSFTATEAMERAEQHLVALARRGSMNLPQHIADIGSESYDRYARLHAAEDKTALFGVRSGYMPFDLLVRHLHLIGATGTGKTTFLIRLIHSLLLGSPLGMIIIDRMGGFSWELMLWLASRFCPQHVRDRLIYIEPSRDDVVLTLNPLLYDSSMDGFYRVTRAVEVILRGWENQNTQSMPRLTRWIFNAFWAAAQLGLTISDCAHFLLPASRLHSRLIALLPEHVQSEWAEITHGRQSDVDRILEGPRNRVKPFFELPHLRRMLGGSRSQLDILQFMRQGKIVLMNLAPQNRLPTSACDTIGSITTNEMLAVVRSLPKGAVLPMFCNLDEFQNFVGPDFEFAIPEVRQKGVRLVCSHQSHSQLIRGDTDLTGVISQLQNRGAFASHGEDADLLAHELAAQTFDPSRIKDELYSTKQRIAGHRIVELESSSESHGENESSGISSGYTSSDARSQRLDDGYEETHQTISRNRGDNSSSQSGRGTSTTRTRGRSQTLVPIHEEFKELSSRTYLSMQEQEAIWGRRVRRLPVGHALFKFANSSEPCEIRIDRSAPGFLGFDIPTIHRLFPWAVEDALRLIEDNFARGPFSSPAAIDREAELRLERVLNGHIVIPPSITLPPPAPGANPFA